MSYEIERIQTRDGIIKIGNGSTAVISFITKGVEDRMSGIATSSTTTEMTVFVARVDLTYKEQISDSISEGAMKLLVSPLDENGDMIANFEDIVKSSNALVTLPDTTTQLSIKHYKLTSPNFGDPILARIYIGG